MGQGAKVFVFLDEIWLFLEEATTCVDVLLVEDL